MVTPCCVHHHGSESRHKISSSVTNPVTGWSLCIWEVTQRRNIRQMNRELHQTMSCSHQLPQKSALSDSPAKPEINVFAYTRPERFRQQGGTYHTKLDCYRSYQQNVNLKGVTQALNNYQSRVSRSRTVMSSAASMHMAASFLSIQTPRSSRHVSLIFPVHRSWLALVGWSLMVARDDLSP